MGGIFSYLSSSTTEQPTSQAASQDVTDNKSHKKIKKVIRENFYNFKAKTPPLFLKLWVQTHPTETAQF